MQAECAAPAIRLRDVSKRYGAVQAVTGVALEVGRGELFGLIGHNGAGKSTLFKMMLGLVAPSAGELRIDGASVRGATFRAVRRKIGYLPENVVLYDNLTGLETLQFFARLKGASLRECLPALERVGLAPAAQRRVREYSKGMRQRLGLAQALLGDPQILVLDEPTNGLDPGGIRQLYEILHALRQNGVTVLLSSHILADIQERVDRLAIMASGRIRAVGSVAELRERARLPLWLTLRLEAHGAERVRAALAGLPVSAIEQHGDSVTLSCGSEHKLRILAALSALNGAVLDVQLREPSLEDVFFGLSERTP